MNRARIFRSLALATYLAGFVIAPAIHLAFHDRTHHHDADAPRASRARAVAGSWLLVRGGSAQEHYFGSHRVDAPAAHRHTHTHARAHSHPHPHPHPHETPSSAKSPHEPATSNQQREAQQREAQPREAPSPFDHGRNSIAHFTVASTPHVDALCDLGSCALTFLGFLEPREQARPLAMPRLARLDRGPPRA